MKRIECQIDGTTCNSCEVLVERKLQKIDGVHMVKVSHKDKRVTIECNEETKLEQLQQAIKSKGYTLNPLDEEHNLKREGNKLFSVPKGKLESIGATLLILVGIYVVITQFNILPEGIGVQEGMSYGFIFVIGLIAATSTCLAVAGGLLLAIAQKYNEKFPNVTGWQKFKPHVSFNIGRIVSYTLLGGVIGSLGSMIAITPKATGIITIIASGLMIIMGLQLLGIFPWLSNIQLKMPKFIAHRLYKNSEKEQSAGYLSSFLFGGSTFFLPCGFTQALQIYVLGTGSFMTGALTMLAFSLGTLPSLAGIGAFTSFVKKGNIQKHFMTFSAVLVIVLGLWNIPNGLALTGSVIGLGGSNAGSPSDALDQGLENVEIVDGVQIVDMSVKKYDYYPHQFTILKDVPVKWRIDGSKAAGCGQVITAPNLGITEFLPGDQIKEIEFTANELGEIPFSCTMGMMTPGAKFTVIENNGQIELESNDRQLEDQEIHGDYVANGLGEAEDNGEYQEMFMEVSFSNGYYPNEHSVKAGTPVKWTIDAIDVPGGCMGTIVIPEYGVAHALKKGETTLEFTPTDAGEYIYTCSMGTVLGKIIVT